MTNMTNMTLTWNECFDLRNKVQDLYHYAAFLAPEAATFESTFCSYPPERRAYMAAKLRAWGARGRSYKALGEDGLKRSIAAGVAHGSDPETSELIKEIKETTQPVNPAIPMKSNWALTYTKPCGGEVTFYWTITNGWQQRHASILDAAKWQFPNLNINRIFRGPRAWGTV